jgi:uracil phosphoribosyltransferase
MIHNLSDENSVFNHFMAEIRDVNIQKDTMRFFRNMERIGEILGYELSRALNYVEVEVTTPLCVLDTNLLKHQSVIASIIRACLPLHQRLLNVFDKAENFFISAYRKHHENGELEIHVDYLASPNLDNKTLILADPMLATGNSMVMVYKALLQKGIPKKIHIDSAVASNEAVQFVMAKFLIGTELWLGAVDAELTVQSYIAKDLGDAGDLLFGEKV